MILISTYVLVFLTYMLVFLTCSNFILRTRAFCIKVTTWIHLCFLNSWVILINCGTLKFFRYSVSFRELSLNTKHQRFLIFKEGREFILKFQSDDLLHVWVSLLNTKKAKTLITFILLFQIIYLSMKGLFHFHWLFEAVTQVYLVIYYT